MRRIGLLFFVLGLSTVVACGGGNSAGGGQGLSVDTVLDKDSVTAGTQVKVSCVVKDKAGKQIEGINTGFQVTPPIGVEPPEGAEGGFIPTKAGDYQVVCSTEKGTVDDTPALLHVSPADPVKTVSTVDPAKVKAGEEAQVTCGAYDKYNNQITDAQMVVDPVKDLDIKGLVVSSKKVGKYEITCSIKDVDVKDKEGSVLEVVPGNPAKVTLKYKPKKKAYPVGYHVTFSYEVTDEFGNPVDWEGEIIAPKAGVKAEGNNRFQFKKEGAYEFKVVLKDPYSDVQDSKTLFCDENPPLIEITYPPRGLEVMGEADLTVKGRVTDDGAGVEWVRVNGDKVQLDEEGKFEYTIHSVHGLNPVLVSAADRVGHKGEVTRGYYFSLDYIPVDEDTKIDDLVVPEGLFVRLNQEALDDGDHDHKHVNDIATIVEILLGEVDYSQLLGQLPPVSYTIPNAINYTVPGLNLAGVKVGVWGDLTLSARITDMQFGQPYVGLTLEDGGIKTDLKIQPVTMTIEISAQLDVEAGIKAMGKKETITLNPGPTGTGTTTGEIGTLVVQTEMLISKAPGDKDIKFKMQNFHVETKDIHIEPLNSFIIDLGTLNLPKRIAQIVGTNQIQLGQFDLTKQVKNFSGLLSKNVLDPLINGIAQPLEKFLEPVVEKAMTLALGKFMNMMKLDKDLEFPAGPLGKIKLHIKTDISTVTFTKEAGLIGLNAGALTPDNVEHDIIGSILRNNCGSRTHESFEFHPDPSMQFAGKYDLINEAIFMVWRSGILNRELDLSKQGMGGGGGGMPINLKDLKITPDFYLPPILNDCNEEGRQEIQVGDLYLDLSFKMNGKQQHLGVWVQAKADVQITGKGNKTGIKIEKISYMKLEIHDLAGNMGSLMDTINMLLPMLKSQIEGKEFDFPIPPIDLGQFIPGVPKGTQIQLGNLGSYHESGYAVIGGDMM